MDTQYLLLWLEAPLQSWGADSKFGRRDTLAFPTRSGVLGLVLCALGASGEQHELLARMAPLRQTVIAYAHGRKNDNGQPEKRAPNVLLRDFHMVGTGYDENHPWQTLHIPKTIEGKKPQGAGTKMTYRYYLQNAVFAVVLEVPVDLSLPFANALQQPVYDLYLGRKNCVPTEFIYQGTFADHDSATSQASHLMCKKSLMEDFRVLDGDHGGERMTVNDVPLQFGTVKKYRDRRVTIVRP